jgi:hypothetical protein
MLAEALVLQFDRKLKIEVLKQTKKYIIYF